jgi:hypothetical protein
MKLLVTLAAACSSSQVIELVGFIEESWGKILGVEYADLFLVDKDEEDGFSEEEALINGRLTDVEAIILEVGGLFKGPNFLLIVGIEGELNDTAPGYGKHGV